MERFYNEYFIYFGLNDESRFQRVAKNKVTQNFNTLQNLVFEISPFEVDAYHGSLAGSGLINFFVGGVWLMFQPLFPDVWHIPAVLYPK